MDLGHCSDRELELLAKHSEQFGAAARSELQRRTELRVRSLADRQDHNQEEVSSTLTPATTMKGRWDS